MDLIELLSIIRRSKWIILVVTLIVTSVVAYRAFSAPPRYEAEVIMTVGDFSPSGKSFSDEDIIAASYAELVNTPLVQEKAFGETGVSGVSVVPVTEKDSPLLRLTGSGSEPEAVADATNAVATALVDRVSEIQMDMLENSRQRLLGELTRVEGELSGEKAKPQADSNRINALQGYRLSLLKQSEELALQMGEGPNLTVVSAATESHFIPARSLRKTILGLAIGLLGGIVVGFVYQSLKKAIEGGRAERAAGVAHPGTAASPETTD